MTEAGKAKAMKGVIKKMLYVRCKNRGFTLVELLTVLAIITMLLGLLVPSLNMVRRIAKETKQKAQLASVEGALTTFRNDYGDYPPSDPYSWRDDVPLPVRDQSGAQKLAEALLGWDLMGFHPDSSWRADGKNRSDYLGFAPGEYFFYDPASAIDMDKRRGRYLELEAANAFRLGNMSVDMPGLFDTRFIGLLAPATFVLCDVFGTVGKVTIGGRTFKAGAPILYYRADTSSKVLDSGAPIDTRMYEHTDNIDVIVAKDVADDGMDGDYPLNQTDLDFFYNVYIRDRKVTAIPWPYRPDSYLLITAGADGIYGTGDDICNFGN